MRRSILLALLAALPAVASAQEQVEEARRGAEGVGSRFIGGWGYIPVTVVQGPFVTTYASSTTGIGTYTLDVDLDLPAVTSRFAGDGDGLDYLGFLQRFDFQLAFLRMLGLRLTAMGEGVIPDSTPSAFNMPVSGTWGAGGGLVARLASTDRLMFSVTADYRYLQRHLISPALWVQRVLEEGRLEGLLSRQDLHRVLAGGSLALAFNRWIGIVAEAGWEGEWLQAGGQLSEPDGAIHFIDLSGAVSANFWEGTIPLGGTAFWRERLPVGEDNPLGHSRQVGGGVFYTGRPYLDFGLELFIQNDTRESGFVVRRDSRAYLAPRIRGYF